MVRRSGWLCVGYILCTEDGVHMYEAFAYMCLPEEYNMFDYHSSFFILIIVKIQSSGSWLALSPVSCTSAFKS